MNFVSNPGFGSTADHTQHWVVELIDDLLETEFCGVMSKQGSPCGYCLLSAISVHLLHRKRKFVCLEEHEQVCQY